MTDDTITMHVHEAAEALLKLRGEQGQITAADIAETVQHFDLDDIEAEALAAELDGLVDDEEAELELDLRADTPFTTDRKSTRLNSSHITTSNAVFCLKKKNTPLCHSTPNSRIYSSLRMPYIYQRK